MKSEWPLVTLGEICELRAGSAFPQRFQGATAGELPFIKVSDMALPGNETYIRKAANWVDEAVRIRLKAKPFAANSVVFAKIGEGLKRNRRRVLLRPTLIDNNMMGATPRDELVDPRFFYYALSQVDFGASAGGSALPYLRASDLSRLEITVPSVPEQRRIAGVLGAVDDKIEQNAALGARGREVADLLFRHAFVASRAHRRRPLGEVVSVCREAIVPAEHPDELFNHFSIPAFDNKRSPVLELGAAILSSKTRVPKGEVILFSKLNPATPRIWWPRPSGAGKAVCSGEFVVLLPTAVPASFLYATLRKDTTFYEEILSHVTGTTGSRQRVKPSEVLACSLIDATPDALASYDSVARPLYDLEAALLRESETLAATRDALLPKLVSGVIRVPDSYDPDDALGTVAEAAGAAVP
jgi:type I restriction enzyme S subunit